MTSAAVPGLPLEMTTCVDRSRGISVGSTLWRRLGRVGQRCKGAGLRRGEDQQDMRQTRDIEPLFVQCWSSVYDAGPTLNQQWLNGSCLLGSTCT